MSDILSIARKFWPTKVRHQLICGVALVHLLLMTFFVVDLVRRQRVFLQQQSFEQTKSLVETLAVNSTSWVLSNDVVGLEEIITPVRRYPGLRYAMVISLDGKVLAHTDPSRIGKYLTDATSRSLLKGAAVLRILHSDPSLLDIAAPIPIGTGRTIAWARIGQGQEQISEGLRAASLNGFLYTLVAILVGSVFAFLIGRRLTSDLDQLLFVSNQIRNNRHDLRMGASRTEEVSRLGEGLNQMLDAITSGEQALRKSAEEIQDLYDHAPCGYHSLDGAGTFVQINATELAWLGYTREQILEKMKFENLLTPQSLVYFRQQFPVFKEQGQVHDLDFELVRKDGTLLPISLSATAIKTAEGGFVMSRSVVHDMTERKREEEAMKRAKEAADTANKAKDQFLAVLSHELRTPLTPVLATVSARQAQADLPEELRADMELIRRNVEMEAKLIDDLLDVTKISQGKIELHSEVLDVHLLLQTALEICQREIEFKHINISLSLQAASHHVQGDPTRLRQVFWNLLKNAVDYSPENSPIRLRTTNIDDRIRIEIRDSGIGIRPELMPKIFNAFERGDQAALRRFGGLGLGLNIAKTVVEMHLGTLTAFSEGEGKGATFTVELPYSTLVSSPPQPPPPSSLDHAERPLKILLVDDHPDTLLAMSKLLRKWGYSIVTADCVRAALEQAAKDSFDLLISDLGLPDGSGLDIMRELKHRYALRGIALSGYGTEEDIRHSQETGFEKHLTKPVSFQDLRQAINYFAPPPDNQR